MLGKTEYDSQWNYGNAIHHGNIILGRIALAEGDIDEAKRRLINAGKTPGSPQLDSFGPNMALAKGLLEKGERSVVIEYLKLCSKFWILKYDDDNTGIHINTLDTLDKWSQEVSDGKIPDFDAPPGY